MVRYRFLGELRLVEVERAGPAFVKCGRCVAATAWAWRRGRPLRSPLLEELEEAATAAKKASSYRRHTANADFGASAGDPDVTIKFWREAWFSRNKAWLPREWKLKNDRRGGYLCWFCSGRRDEASRLHAQIAEWRRRRL